MDLESIKKAIVTNVYHIKAGQVVPLHQHAKNDELFYCIAGSGYGVLQGSEVELSAGRVFVVPAGTMHALRTEGDLVVCSFLVPQAC